MKIENILKSIGKHTEPVELPVILDIFLSGYHSSYKKIRGVIFKREGLIKENKERIRREKQNFYNLVNYLIREGLVNKKVKKDEYFLVLTKKGSKRINEVEKKKKKEEGYKAEEDKTFKIIIFDIPENEREKRKWLRDRLIDMGFKIIQKSVWIGKKKIPSEFLEDLRELKMLSYIEIFTAERLGTLVSEKVL